MSRLLAIDLGTKRTGLAISDELQISVRELQTLHTAKQADILAALDELTSQYTIEAIVVGYPFSLDGTEGPAARKVEQFCQTLEAKGYVVIRMDERYSSLRAEARMHGGKVVNKTERAVDAVAARIILEDYFATKDQS